MANSRPFVNQGLYLQRETVPGTPQTTAMNRYLGLRATSIGWDISRESFTPSGSKVAAGEITNTEMGTMNVEAVQDYNSLMPLLAGALGAPTSTPGTVVGTHEHVFTVDPFDAEEVAAYTAIFGDAVQALQASNTVFHGMTLGVTRTGLSLSTSTLLRSPETGATVPTTGVTDIPMVPARASTYCVYIDNSWATLGTTKMLGLYSTQLNFGDKYSPEWVVDCALESFAELVENSDVSMTQDISVRFDAAAVALIESAKAGGKKFVRVEATGPEIAETGEFHMLTIDTCVGFNPGEISESSVAPTVAVNMSGPLLVDDLGNVARVTLVNGLATL